MHLQPVNLLYDPNLKMAGFPEALSSSINKDKQENYFAKLHGKCWDRVSFVAETFIENKYKFARQDIWGYFYFLWMER